MVKEWYKEWFNSPYYHILYKNRDEHEAEQFIDELLNTLEPAPNSRILDLACGRGRYSLHLAGKGYQVTGIDLSVESIRYARRFESELLTFYTHDMRQPFRVNYFDYIFNFFTSFGYFETVNDDLRTLKNVAAGLRPDGIFVLDFFNSNFVTDQLTGREVKIIDGIKFDIHKRIEGNFVRKSIRFQDHDRDYLFEEKVRLFRFQDFMSMFETAGLDLIRTYGSYRLESFDPKSSPRLILVATKKDD